MYLHVHVLAYYLHTGFTHLLKFKCLHYRCKQAIFIQYIIVKYMYTYTCTYMKSQLQLVFSLTNNIWNGQTQPLPVTTCDISQYTCTYTRNITIHIIYITCTVHCILYNLREERAHTHAHVQISCKHYHNMATIHTALIHSLSHSLTDNNSEMCYPHWHTHWWSYCSSG